MITAREIQLVLLTLMLAGGVMLGSGCVSKQSVGSGSTLAQEPVTDPALMKEDFAFPSRPPRLSHGKQVFEQNCAVCHRSISYDKIKSLRPIDEYLLLTRGDNNHPTFKQLTRDQRWEAVFYAYHLAGGTEIHNKDTAAIFGSNCAVCHGTKGFADGPLYTGHAPHGLAMAPVKNAFEPPPANFHSYARMYNRSDDMIVKFISEGVYPSAMPSWKGRVDKAKNVTFDDNLIHDLMKHVRSFAYENDLEDAAHAEASKNSPSKGS